jgi:hypothetical protein
MLRVTGDKLMKTVLAKDRGNSSLDAVPVTCHVLRVTGVWL